jgi:hypothetical protein
LKLITTFTLFDEQRAEGREEAQDVKEIEDGVLNFGRV